MSDYFAIYDHLADVEKVCGVVVSDNSHGYLVLVFDDGEYKVYRYDFQDKGDSYEVNISEMSTETAMEENKDLRILVQRYQVL